MLSIMGNPVLGSLLWTIFATSRALKYFNITREEKKDTSTKQLPLHIFATK